MTIQDLYRASNIGGVTGPSKTESSSELKRPVEKRTGPSEFQELLETEQNKVNLSSHAETRIRSREIAWNPQLEARISKGMDQAQSKGSREALILADNIAVIANVKSRTVVTAMDRSQMKERVFTNIDSAVLV